MKVVRVHQRMFDATPEQLAALIADFATAWPVHILPPPRPEGHLLWNVGLQRWQEFDRPGALRAFRVLGPPELQGEHWFETERVEDRTLLRHTIDGECAVDAMWREIEPRHDLMMEALLDNVERLVAARGPGGTGAEPPDSPKERRP